MDKEIRAILERPFDDKLIKKRRGRDGGTWDYIATANIIERLNEAFDGDWNFEVVESSREGDEILILGKLSHAGTFKMQYGGKKIAVKKATGEPVCIPDDYKSAASDALKKCATLFGVALGLYMDSSDREADSPADERQETEQGKAQGNKEKAAGEPPPPKHKTVIEARTIAREVGIKDVKVFLEMETTGNMTLAEWEHWREVFKGYRRAAKFFAEKINNGFDVVCEWIAHRAGDWDGFMPDIRKAYKDDDMINELWEEFTIWREHVEDALEKADETYIALVKVRFGEDDKKRQEFETTVSKVIYPEWGLDEYENAITALKAADALKEKQND